MEKLPFPSKLFVAIGVHWFNGSARLDEVNTEYGQPGTPLLPLKTKLPPFTVKLPNLGGGVGKVTTLNTPLLKLLVSHARFTAGIAGTMPVNVPE